MSGPAKTAIFVSVLTYRRPQTLRRLLDSLTTLCRPADYAVTFLIVDNDPDASACPIVDGFQPQFGNDLIYIVEEEPGIPAARNRALDEAIGRGGKLLCFLDDDEEPDRQWLVELVGHFEKTGAVLIGGPVFARPAAQSSLWRRFLASGITARSRFMGEYCSKEARKGRIIKLGTGNWLCDLDWVSACGIRFDDSLRDSGGEDTAFLFAVQAHGGQVEWCSTAVAYEDVPAERLTLSYQIAQSRARAIVVARLRPENRLRMCIWQSFRMVFGIGLLLFPLYGRASFMLGIYLISASLGRMSSLAGFRSRLYQRA